MTRQYKTKAEGNKGRIAADAITSLHDLEIIQEELKRQNYRDYLAFLIGCNTGLRINDILALRVKDVRTGRITIKESKVDKSRDTRLNSKVLNALEPWLEGKGDDQYLFQSRKGDNQPITTTQANRAFKKAVDYCGLADKYRVTTHTMRKSFGYHYYKRTKDIALLMKIFNHSSQSVTMDYIGMTQEHIETSLIDFEL